MDATKPIYVQIQELRKMWREIWWSMAGGIKSEYDKIKSTNVFEYWLLYDLWKEKVNREREFYESKNKKK